MLPYMYSGINSSRKHISRMSMCVPQMYGSAGERTNNWECETQTWARHTYEYIHKHKHMHDVNAHSQKACVHTHTVVLQSACLFVRSSSNVLTAIAHTDNSHIRVYYSCSFSGSLSLSFSVALVLFLFLADSYTCMLFFTFSLPFCHFFLLLFLFLHSACDHNLQWFLCATYFVVSSAAVHARLNAFAHVETWHIQSIANVDLGKVDDKQASWHTGR